MTRFHHDIIISEVYNPQVEEEKIRKFWQKEKTFEKLKKLRREQNDGKFSFHSAPVAPSGHPHSGHILNSLVKDVLKRYGYQKNLRVENTFRWDDHGLPIQGEADKNLGNTRGFQKIHDVKLCNDECRAVTEGHTAEWMSVFERMGNCIDSPKTYRTSDTRYMEGVWKVFKQLFEKGLVYRDTKNLPYSTGCSTHLTNFEAEQNLKEVREIGFTIALDIVGSSEKLLIWTTNPLSLTFNSGLSVNPKDLYVKIKVKDQIYILSKNRLQSVFKNSSEYTVLEEVMGKSLENLKCEPLFENIPLSTGYRVYTDSTTSRDISVGTGITPSDELEMGSLKNGHILNTREVKYQKPHCLKTGTPLVAKRVDSWFVRVEDIVDDLVKNISSVNWFPEGQKSEEDLINWLKEQPADWVISRNRNWGTPLPIWSSASGDEIICVGSLEELKAMSGKRDIHDLHREVVDLIRIPSKTPENPSLRRVSDVFDGWFDTSVLPFIWKQSDQADFVSEGVNHTRGWFYTMLVLATALSEPPPFRNVFTHAFTLEPNGSKVNKRKHNHNDPIRLYEKYGADALRLYLLSHLDSNFIVEEEGVAKMAETIIQPLYRIFHKCTDQMGSPSWINYGYITDWSYEEGNPLDRWILSCSESILKLYIEDMNSYRINTFLPKVIELIQQIEEWYIPARCPYPDRQNKEFEVNSLSIHRSTTMLFNVIYRLCLVLAPVAPFLTEFIFQIHRKWMVYYRCPDSMHGAQLFPADERIIKPDLVRNVQQMQNVVRNVRLLRAQYMVPIQYQIQEVIVIHHNEEFREGITSVKESFKKILNTRAIEVSDNHREFQASLRVDLKESSNSKEKQAALKELNEGKLNLLIKLEDLEESIQLEDLQISYKTPKKTDANYALVSSGDLLVVIKMNKSLFFYEEGTIKELIHQICNLKKRNEYYRSDCVVIYYSTEDECLKNVIAKHCKHLNQTANCDLKMKEGTEDANIKTRCLVERVIVKGAAIKMFLDVKCE